MNKETSTNTYKDKTVKLMKQVKKEHFIKLFLTLITSILMVLVLSLVIFSITPFVNGELKDGIHQVEYYASYELNDKKVLVGVGELLTIQKLYSADPNALFVFNGNKNNIVLIVSLIGGSGWLVFLSYITSQKNMITPQAIKKTVRKALQFNYLKQKDVEFISDEIDYNIGIKERVKNEEDVK